MKAPNLVSTQGQVLKVGEQMLTTIQSAVSAAAAASKSYDPNTEMAKKERLWKIGINDKFLDKTVVVIPHTSIQVCLTLRWS